MRKILIKIINFAIKIMELSFEVRVKFIEKQVKNQIKKCNKLSFSLLKSSKLCKTLESSLKKTSENMDNRSINATEYKDKLQKLFEI